MENKQEMINWLRERMPILAQVGEMDERFVYAEMQMDQKRAQIQEIRRPPSVKKILITLLVLLVLASLARSMIVTYSKESLVLGLQTLVGWVIPTALAILIYIWYKKYKSNQAKTLEAEIADLEAQRQVIQNEGMALLSTTDIPAVLPPECMNAYAGEFLINALSSMRADTMKEALLLYDQHMHQLRMEQGQQNIMLMQQENARGIAEAKQMAANAQARADSAYWNSTSNY